MLTKEELENLSTDELRQLKATIEEILSSRETKKEVIYVHDCWNSSNYHHKKYRHWCKLVRDIDDTKTNGYAFIGEFLKTRAENLVPVGSIVVETCADEYSAYRITGDYEKELVAEGKRSALVSFIREVKEALEGPP